MKSLTWLILPLTLLTACDRKGTDVLTIDLKYSDYTETIIASGTVQAVNTVNLIVPRVNFSGLNVGYLADEGSHVNKGDTVCIIQAPELNNMIETFQLDLEKMEAELKKLEADNAMQMALMKAQIEINKSEVAIKMLDSAQLKYSPPLKRKLIGLELQKANIEKSKLAKKLAAQKRIDMSEVMQLKSRINIQKSRIEGFKNQLKSLKLVAPRDGIALHYEAPQMRYFSSMGAGSFGGRIEEGSNVFGGMTVLQLPDMNEMQVQIEAPEMDFKRIRENQKTFIDVDAQTVLHTTGKIKRKTLGSGAPGEKSAIKTYQVTISVDSCHLMMKPGSSAMCRIIVDEVKDTIVIPASALFTRDTSKIVYVKTGENSFSPVEVETGFNDGSKCIISKGLIGNETIALMEPPYKLIDYTQKTSTDSLKVNDIEKSSFLKNIFKNADKKK
jgi:multidrug efflux pump subunit AcrA (membrane-fusion protein)